MGMRGVIPSIPGMRTSGIARRSIVALTLEDLAGTLDEHDVDRIIRTIARIDRPRIVLTCCTGLLGCAQELFGCCTKLGTGAVPR